MKLPSLPGNPLCWCLLWALAGLAVVAGGCMRPQAAGEVARPTLLNPRWTDDAFAEHLGFFRDALLDGETPASTPVGEYVSARMHEAWLQPVVERRYRLGGAPDAPWGYVGYVGGKNPSVAREAVLVCADLRGTGAAASAGEGAAPEAAALLSVARLYGLAAQYAPMPERSVIFALWPQATAGEGAPLAGLREYLRQPTWRLDQVRAVVYVGLPARLRPEADTLLAAHDIPLYRVEAPSGAALEDAEVPAEEDAGGDPARAAVLRVRSLAQRTHERLRAATLTSGPIMPSLGDTLRVPAQELP